MKSSEVLDKVKECGFPCTLGLFRTPQKGTYAVLRAGQSQNVYSDSKILRRAEDFTVELYYRNVNDRLKFEDELTQRFIWQRYTADIALKEDGTELMASYELIGDNYEHYTD